MSTGAVLMMLVAMTVIWGGLALAIWNLNSARSKEPRHVQREI